MHYLTTELQYATSIEDGIFDSSFMELQYSRECHQLFYNLDKRPVPFDFFTLTLY